MNLQELIDFHTVGAESCEAYAVTPDADAAKNKDIAKHYNKRAKWHRDAIALVQGLRPVQVNWSDVEPWYLANEQMLSDIRKFEGPKGFALEVWRGARS